MTDAGSPGARALTILTPATRAARPFPKRAAIVLAAAIALSIPNPAHWGASNGLLKLLAVGSAVWIAAWLEERAYARFVGRRGFARVAAALAMPFAFAIAIPAGALIGAPLAFIGDDATTTAALTLACAWAASAAVGSLVVVLIDVVVSVFVQRFRSRVQLAVLTLVGLAALVSGVVAALAASVPELAHTIATKLHVTTGKERLTAAELQRRLADPHVSHIVSLALVSAVAVLSLPAVLSACGKLADAVMERLVPLARAFDAVGSGELRVRVEEAGSHDFRQLAGAFNQMVERLSLAQNMERAFGQYVSGQVLGRIREQHGEAGLPAELREATVFFADIRGFTSMSEKLAPAVVLGILNRYFERVIAVIDAAEGYLDKFVGDAVVVVFNGPIDQPDHAERGARCAIALQQEVTRLNAEGAFPEVGAIQVGVGVATGPLVAGNLGSARHMEYTVIGDTVNLAARLTGRAGPGEVWIDARNARLLPDTLPRQGLPPLSVKGKAEAVMAYRIWPPPGQSLPPAEPSVAPPADGE